MKAGILDGHDLWRRFEGVVKVSSNEKSVAVLALANMGNLGHTTELEKGRRKRRRKDNINLTSCSELICREVADSW